MCRSPGPARPPFPDLVGVVTWAVALVAAGVVAWLFTVDLGKIPSATQQAAVGAVSAARFAGVYVFARCVHELARAARTEPLPGP